MELRIREVDECGGGKAEEFATEGHGKTRKQEQAEAENQ